jgi:hypothetical protein
LTNYVDQNLNYTQNLTFNFGGGYDPSSSSFLNKWLCVAITSDNTASILYLDGQLTSGGARSSIDEDFGINFRIGTRYTTSSQWTGYFGPVLAYNRVLSSDEILQSYNAFKTRFGK